VNVLVAKDGKVVYEKSFGSLTYDKKSPVTDETIFDLASITKVSATLQTVMYMQEKGLIDINKKLPCICPSSKDRTKKILRSKIYSRIRQACGRFFHSGQRL